MTVTGKPNPAHIATVVANAMHAIVFTDADGVIEFHNDAVATLFGYEPEELLGQPIRTIIPDDLGLEVGEIEFELPPNLILAFAGGSVDMRARRKDGESFVAHITVACLDEFEKTAYAITIIDISSRLTAESDRRRLEQQLAQARKLEAVGQLAAGVAHEINTPTQFIGDNLQFLRDSFSDLTAVLTAYKANADSAAEVAQRVDLDYLVDEIPCAVEQALEGISQISEILAAMKAFCHPGQSEKLNADLNATISNVASVSRSEWKYVATLELDLATNLPSVLCNENEIRQVLLNLIINASHALEDQVKANSGELGQLRVSSRYTDGDEFVEIEVADNGPGIPTEVLPYLFDPFFTTKEVGKGTGQGLAVVHAIVAEQHGGEIEVRSEPGEGAAFVLRLPL